MGWRVWWMGCGDGLQVWQKKVGQKKQLQGEGDAWRLFPVAVGDDLAVFTSIRLHPRRE